MNGPDAPAEPYILRSHSEAGWGCVPQVLFKKDRDATMVHYFSDENPRMSIYSGQIVACYPKFSAGCRTNLEMAINGVDDVRDLIVGPHQVICYGDIAEKLRTFCKLTAIEAVP